MNLPQTTIDRITAEANEMYEGFSGGKIKAAGYIDGATAQATRALPLYEALKQIQKLIFNASFANVSPNDGKTLDCVNVVIDTALASYDAGEAPEPQFKAGLVLPFTDASNWTEEEKQKLVEATMRLAAAPIINTMAMLGTNSIMQCIVDNKKTGDEYEFSFRNKKYNPEAPEPGKEAKEVISPRVAFLVLAVKDALAQNKMEEAYHQLYQIASPDFDKYQPWAELEELAKQWQQSKNQQP